ncbi:transmembrane alpha-helix domain-containing protein [Pochonia chlamydosporia 170]|uniref:Transmembrane alpha-helix domain-containing protein n=1 Tax=Pochonia chlamydosporia 170 TaxID=1380566 RepID=A0A179FWL2_METCM|nr:transmembrane alpha-helix domain-containing protein [Pochonia chlamydosporia 170]OAQ70014.2 transmembrane alpha-helix domain-containing protein [Pochonia chlamydosporia 170]
MGDDLKPAKLDPNVWYHVTEGRVDNFTKTRFDSMFQIVDVQKNNGDHLAVWGNLGTCYNKDEIDDNRTQPCLLRSDGSDTQKWDITIWPGDNTTYRLQNVQNGTKYNMDVHMGNPPFMSSDTDPKIYQKAQHWLMTSVSDINEAAYSTTFTDVPVSATQTLHSTSPTAGSGSSSSSGLSSGAAAGIGVGVALGVIGLGIAGFLLWRRRKRAASRGAYSSTPSELGGHPDIKTGGAPGPHSTYYDPKSTEQAHEMMHNPVPQEVPGQMHYELDATTTQGHTRNQ